MKRSILLFTTVLGIGYLTLTSYQTGPAFGGVTPKNRTGSGPTPTATCGDAGCHGANDNATTIGLSFQDGAGNNVTKYTPGATYHLLLSGTKAGTVKYGFQITAVQSASITTQAGGFVPGTNTHSFSESGIIGLEHSAPFVQSSLGTTFDWFAPVTGVGDVKFYVIVNATNGNGLDDGGDHATATSFTLPQIGTSVTGLSQNIHITAYPNPAADNLNLKFEDAEAGMYTVTVLDMIGRTLHTESLQVNGSSAEMHIPSGNWASGLYFARIEKAGAQRVLPVVKQ